MLLLIIAAFYWKLTLTYQYDWVWGPDIAQQVLPWFEEEARQMHHGRFPLWDPHSWAGQPMLGQAQPGAAYPLNWLLFLLPLNKGYIDTAFLQWYFVAIRYMAALFCYLLCRDLKLSRTAAIAGALVFGLGAYVGTVMWPQMVNGAVWIPLVFLFLWRAVRGYRPLASAALCGLFWGISWLAGHHQVPIFLSLAAAASWTYYAINKRSWRIFGLALVSISFMLSTAAFQILPAAEYGRLAKRWVGTPKALDWNQPVPYGVQQALSTSPFTAFGIVIPGIGDNATPFIGTVAFAFAAIGIAANWRRTEAKLAAALALSGFFYALGGHDVFQGMIYAVAPFVDKARTPAMAIVFFGFGAAVLTAFGVDWLGSSRESGLGRWAGWGLAGSGIFIGGVLFYVFAAKGFSWPGDDRPGITPLIAIVAGVLLLAWQRRTLNGNAARVLLMGLMLFELGNVSGADFADRNDYTQSRWLEATRSNEDIVAFLDTQPRPLRIEMETEELGLNWPEYYNFDEIKSYLAGLTLNWTETEFWTPQERSLFGVRYTIGRSTKMPGAAEVFDGKSGMKVFENPLAFPRAWAVHRVNTVSSPAEGCRMIREHLDELRASAFTVGLREQVRLSPCAGADRVTVTRYEPGHITIRAAMACDGLVVLSDTFYPGWKAAVDKRPAQIEEVDLTMRAVPVPKGTHEVQYTYRPLSTYAGAAFSVSGVLGACVFAFFPGRRRNGIDLTTETRNNQI